MCLYERDVHAIYIYIYTHIHTHNCIPAAIVFMCFYKGLQVNNCNWEAE